MERVRPLKKPSRRRKEFCYTPPGGRERWKRQRLGIKHDAPIAASADFIESLSQALAGANHRARWERRLMDVIDRADLRRGAHGDDD